MANFKYNFMYNKIHKKNLLLLSQDGHPPKFFQDKNLQLLIILKECNIKTPTACWPPSSGSTQCLFENLAPRTEQQTALGHLLPSVALRGTQLNPQSKAAQCGSPDSLLRLPGQKGPRAKNIPNSTPCPCCCFLRPRSISQSAVGSCSWAVKRAETIQGGMGWGSLSAEHTLASPQIALVSCGRLANANGAGTGGSSLQALKDASSQPPSTSLWPPSWCSATKLDQPPWAPCTRPSRSIWKRFESLR